MKTLTLRRPDDWHLHCRDADLLQRTVPDAAKQFARALIMPNLLPPVIEPAQAAAYRQRIIAAVPASLSFTPLMSLYLSDQTTPAMIKEACESGFIIACKLYPMGATTHSDAGISDIKKLYPIFEAMQQYNRVLSIHGEVADPTIDIFQREQHFIDHNLNAIVNAFPSLRIVLEHISSQYAVDYITSAPNTVAATITAHHLLLNRNHLLADTLQPHYFCKPILKRAQDQQALITAAISANPKFFLGTDSAPHAKLQKESACGCAGIYTSLSAIELYAQVFERHDALDKLEAFASEFGADFYELPRNSERITLAKQPWTIPNSLSFGETSLIPFGAQQTINWKIMNE